MKTSDSCPLNMVALLLGISTPPSTSMFVVWLAAIKVKVQAQQVKIQTWTLKINNCFPGKYGVEDFK